MAWLRVAWRFVAPVAKSAGLWYVIGGISIAATAYGLYQHVIGHADLKANYQSAVLERDAANAQVSQLIKDHKAEIARKEADRIEAHNLRKQYRKDAQIENAKLKNKLAENSVANDWYNSLLPDDIKRLREQRKTAPAQRDTQSGPPGGD